MENGYPAQDDIAYILECAANSKRFKELANYLCDIWHYKDYATFKGNILKLTTGGWSGHEEIVGCLIGTFFWHICWQQSTKDGYFEFTLPDDK